MIKENLKRFIGITAAVITMLTTAAYAAKPAKMIVDVPGETLDSLTFPFDDSEAMSELLNSLNGVDENGDPITDADGNQVKSNDVYGWQLKRVNLGTISNKNGGVQFGSWAHGQCSLSNNKTISDLSQPFELQYKIYIAPQATIVLGDETGNDYIKIAYGPTTTITRQSGSEQQTATFTLNMYNNSATVNGTLKWDGSSMVLLNDGTEVARIDNCSPLSSGTIQIKSTNAYHIFSLNYIKLMHPSTVKENSDFYLSFTNYKEDDLTKTALTEGGWSANNDATTIIVYGNGNNRAKFPANTKLLYDTAQFSGDYTVKTSANVSYNALHVKFNYKDSNNYYEFRTGAGSGTEKSKLILAKCVNGTTVMLDSTEYSGYFVSQTLKFNVTDNEDGSITINLLSPGNISYTDDGEKEGYILSNNASCTASTTEKAAAGEPILQGKVCIEDASGGFLQIKDLYVYPTANEGTELDNFKFDFYTDGVKAEGNTVSKGITTISMPKKYMGLRNKVIVALYDNYTMKAAKIYDAMDFCRYDELEAFDTSSCSENAKIGVFMWNSLDMIRPLMSETFVSVQ